MMKGGEKLLKRLREIALNVAKARYVDVGFFADSTYDDGTSVPLVAASNEYGTERIPSRPFFRSMVNEKNKNWPHEMSVLLAINNYDAEKTLEMMGQRIAGDLRVSISEFQGVPLSPKTIKRKGHDKQLIDTGKMLASVSHKVGSKR